MTIAEITEAKQGIATVCERAIAAHLHRYASEELKRLVLRTSATTIAVIIERERDDSLIATDKFEISVRQKR
jgi:hypothetical protein